MIDRSKFEELIRLRQDQSLYHRESKELEFKEQFNFAGLAEYFRDFAAFANNTGGYIIFGVSNSPRKLIGLSAKAKEQFDKIDPEKISGSLLEIFSPDIMWEQHLFEFKNKTFGIFYIYKSTQKPIIAKKDEGRDNLIRNGDIYFRYAGRTQKIQFSELSFIIEQKVKETNNQWMSLMSKIAKTGPANAAILDTERGVIEKSEDQILVIDEALARKIKFIKEGQFKETEGGTTLQLVGDVRPIGKIEVTKTIQKRLLDQYPFAYRELETEIKRQLPWIRLKAISAVIKELKMKDDQNYSAYNFRKKSQDEEYSRTGHVPKGTPSIYNQNAIDIIVKILKEQRS